MTVGDATSATVGNARRGDGERIGRHRRNRRHRKLVAPGEQVAPAVPEEQAARGGTGGSGPLARSGCRGFGSYATGGRGGSVIYVTNLNADGRVFTVGHRSAWGEVHLRSRWERGDRHCVHLTNGDVTIAGQTSPGGITIRGLHPTNPYQDQDVRPADYAENWILQHIRIRRGSTGQ